MILKDPFPSVPCSKPNIKNVGVTVLSDMTPTGYQVPCPWQVAISQTDSNKSVFLGLNKIVKRIRGFLFLLATLLLHLSTV